MKISKNIIIYIIIGIIITIGIIFLITSLKSQSYLLTVNINPLNSNGTLMYTGLYPYNTTFFEVMIKNTGPNNIVDIPIAIYLGGKLFKSYNVTLPTGKGAAIHFNYTYTHSGTFTFKAIADPAGLFNIKDRNLTSDTIIININKPTHPSQYLTLPEHNITTTQDTLLKSKGLAIAYLLGSEYNSSIFTNMFGPEISGILLNYISPDIVSVYSAYARYENGNNAYTAWMQGTITPQTISKLFKSKNITVNNLLINNTKVGYAIIKNNTVFCINNKAGWTRFTFYTGFINQTCNSFVNNNNDSATYMITNAINNSKDVLAYQRGFMYANSMALGSSLIVNRSNFYVISLFYNRYGYFATLIKKFNQLPNNFTPICYGSIYNGSGESSICGSSIIKLRGIKDTALTNVTEFFENYRFSVYSLVNSSAILKSYLSSSRLINHLKINHTPLKFVSNFKKI